MKAGKFKPAREVQQGIEIAIDHFVYVARRESRDARKYLARSRTGQSYWYDEYLRAKSKREAWMDAAKCLLLKTTTGRVHQVCRDRRIAKWDAEHPLTPPAPQALTREAA